MDALEPHLHPAAPARDAERIDPSASLGLSGGIELDDLNRRLIEELRQDGRAPAAALARRLGVSRETIRFRMGKLREDHIIRKFTVLVDRRTDRADLVAFTLVNLASGPTDQSGVGEAIARIAGIVEVHDVAGRPDFVVKIRGASLAGIGERVNRMREIPGVARTEILACVTTYKEES